MRKSASCNFFLFVFSFITFPASAYGHDLLTDHLRNQRLIAHALGGIDGHAYTNSKEAFLRAYKNGFRIFEADLILTSDDVLVLRHSWNKASFRRLGQELPEQVPQQRLTHAEFLHFPILEKLTPLDLRGMLLLLKEHPDAYLVTDTKRTSKRKITKAFKQISIISRELGVSERIIPQVYNESMIAAVRAVDSFPNLIYTLYQEPEDNEYVLSVIEKHEIRFVTVPRRRITQEFVRQIQERNALAFTHTVNDRELAERYFTWGVAALYTDKLLPADFRKANGFSQ